MGSCTFGLLQSTGMVIVTMSILKSITTTICNPVCGTHISVYIFALGELLYNFSVHTLRYTPGWESVI